jgi:hypothetical protein
VLEGCRASGPGCRPVAISLSSPGEDGLDSSAGAAGGLGLLLPDRLECLDDEVDVDRRDRQPAEHRRCVGLKRLGPLLAMLGVAPAGPLSRDALGGALVEALGLSVPCRSGGPGNVARLDRVAGGGISHRGCPGLVSASPLADRNCRQILHA